MAEQKCEFCGITTKDCRSWRACPIAFGPVCHKCHEKCKHLKIMNGYMELCLMRNKPEKA